MITKHIKFEGGITNP